jgi:flagellar motor switch protein FliN/FliY
LGENDSTGEIGDHMSDDELSSLMKDLLSDPDSGVETARLPNLDEVQEAHPDGDQKNFDLDLLMDVDIKIRVELGRTNMYVDDVLHLSDGAVVQLDKLAGDPVDILANDKMIARGEVLVLNDNFCVRITEIIDPREIH